MKVSTQTVALTYPVAVEPTAVIAGFHELPEFPVYSPNCSKSFAKASARIILLYKPDVLHV